MAREQEGLQNGRTNALAVGSTSKCAVCFRRTCISYKRHEWNSSTIRSYNRVQEVAPTLQQIEGTVEQVRRFLSKINRIDDIQVLAIGIPLSCTCTKAALEVYGTNPYANIALESTGQHLSSIVLTTPTVQIRSRLVVCFTSFPRYLRQNLDPFWNSQTRSARKGHMHLINFATTFVAALDRYCIV